jgi:uncharacterized protein YecT (DUF1311 family)
MYLKMLRLTLFKTFLILLAPLIVSKNVSAAQIKEICSQEGQSHIVLSQCLDRKIDAIDRELQTWVNNQIFVLEEFALTTGRRSSLEMFRRSQRNFTTYRENNCRWQYLYISPNIDAASVYKKCYILLSRGRVNELSKFNNAN